MIKKIFTIITLFTAISCAHQDQKIKLNLSLDAKKLEIANPVEIDFTVIDDRLNKKTLGQKEFGEKSVYLIIDQNLADFLQQKISQAFVEKGLKIGNDRIIELHVKTFKYSAKSGFPLGESSGEIALQIIIKNEKSGEKLTRNFSLALKNKHFLRPLEATDSKTANALLQEVVQDFLDDAVIKDLVK
jgi:uncharacterized lipoprotein YajG